MIGDETRLNPNELLFQYKSIEKFEEQLNFVMLLLYSLEGKEREKFREEIVKLEEIFLSDDIKRRVRLRDSMVKLHPVQYFGYDFGDDDPFIYDKEIEEMISEVSLELISILGRIITTLQEGTKINLDGM